MAGETLSYLAIQGTPTQLEVDVDDAMGATSIMWWQIVLVPLLLAAGGLIKAWFDSRSGQTTALINGYVEQVRDLSRRVSELSDEQTADRARIASLERLNSRSDLRGDRMHRIAHRALDRIDDTTTYLRIRDSERDRHDPDHTLTAWVPEAPAHLLDETWTTRMRAELAAYYDDDLDIDDASEVGG